MCWPLCREITSEDYEGLVRKLIRFLEGDTEDVVKELNARMRGK